MRALPLAPPSHPARRRAARAVRVMAVLALAVACESEPVVPPQATPKGPIDPALTPTVHPVGEEQRAPKPVEDTVLLANNPSWATLSPELQQRVIHTANMVTAPCAPCAEESLARCQQQAAPGCENVPALLVRLGALAPQGLSDRQLELAVAFGDVWIPEMATGSPGLAADRVVVQAWIDPAGPSLVAAAETVSKLPAAQTELHLHVGTDEAGAPAQALARGLAAADLQGQGPAFLACLSAARATPRAPLPDATVVARGCAGLDAPRWEAALSGEAVTARLAADQALRAQVGVRSWPTWFLNGYRLRGLQSDIAIGRILGLELDDLRWSPTSSGRPAASSPVATPAPPASAPAATPASPR